MAELLQTTTETPPLVLGELEQTHPMRRLVRMLLPFLGLLLVIGPFSFLDAFTQSKAQNFLSQRNFEFVILQTVVVAVAAMGMTFVIISGGIDLSVGSVVALSTVATALTLLHGIGPWQPAADAASIMEMTGLIITAAFVGIGVAMLAGLLNGLMITGLRIVPFIATLGMWSVARGVAKLLAEEQAVYPPENWLPGLMAFWYEPPGWPRAIPLPLLIMLAVALTMGLILNYTTFGRYTIAIGSNEATARLCGVRVRRIKIGIYTLAGVMTGIAGVLQFSRLTVGDPTVSVGLELDVIAAVVIGGGSLSGGEGSIVGTLIGALAMSFLRSGCTLMNWPNFIQEIFIGIFIVIFVAIDQLRRARTA